MWSLPASEGESATAHFFLGAGDEGLGTRGIGMRTEESDSELLEDEEDEVPPEPQIIVGICAMTKKSKSKPMTQILERLCRFDYLTVIILGEDVILNEPVENWPSCHCLISFHSKGFPLDKAVAYSKLRNPFLINDLAMQYYIQDRREVYRILQEEGIDLPRYAVLNRDPARPEECNLIEGEDQVEVNGAVFPKPFVEKPVSAEDHNVYIYYPSSAGGGSQRLFRKIGSRSSVYSPESSVRKTGSYIYEEFMPTDGTDVKVYTVGPDYAHAEARKSPALDGKVERDSEGKEIRYPVMLTAMEKLVARKVCVAFKQTVCGFDLLRANGHSFVCDVNGFSFVKNSMKYYDDCAKILGNTIMRELAPQFQIPWSIPTEAEDIPIVPTTSGTMMELRCVIAIIRHGDRTPKQKMKMEVTHPRFFSLFEKHGGYKTGKLKLKRPEQLQEVLDITRLLLAELEKEPGGEIEEKTGKLEQLKSVLEMYGHFSGINRKVQLTYYPHGVKATNEGQDPQQEALAPSLLLVLKWGGELTPDGRVQAEELGRAFRCMYPGGQGDYAGFPGCGLLRLHSTFRHDLKIYASDEGRVQMTAAAFAKGLLALEGELTPILVQMVKSANMNGLLDSDGDSLSSCQHRVKARLHHILQQDAPFGPEDYDQLAPTGSTSLLNSMAVIQNPVKVCDQVFALIENLTHQIRERMQDPKSVDLQLYHSETLELMLQRWSKLERDFRQKSGRYDISKIPDIYDCVKYDVQHNGSLGLQGTAELLRLSKALADVVIPQEYGISREEKLEIAVGFCLPLLRKILLDLQRTHEDESVNKLHPLYSRGVLSPGRHVRTRLYFTSESHVHSLLSVFRYGGLLDETQDAQWQRALAYLSAISELNYMTQIVIMLYEDNTRDPLSEERFHVELHFSPGVKGVEEEGSAPTGCGFRPASSENEEMKTDQGSMENLCPGKASDEPDRALQTSPQPPEGPGLPRRSPLIRNRKAGSMEVMNMQCTGNLDLIPLRGRRRRRSGDLPRPSPAIGLQPRAVSTTHLASCTQVLSETSSSRPGGYRLFSSARPPTEMKQSGLGSQCTGLFSTTVLGGSSSAPNLQDYARSHGKKLPPASLKHRDELLFVPAVKRFSVSFAKHPTNELLDDQHPVVRLLRSFSSDCPGGRPVSLDATLAHHLHQCSYHLRLFRNWLRSGQDDPECLYGFEGCSMVPTIYPLETLHNALSLRQVSEFLSRVCQRHTDAQAQASAALFDSMHSNQASDSLFSPPRTLHSPTLQLRQRSEKPPWYSSGPSSTVSSAGPSSPTAVDGNCPFGFSDQPSVSSHMIEEHQSLGMLPRNGEQEFLIEGVQEPFEPSQSSQEPPVETSQPCQEVAEVISQPCQEVPDVSQPWQESHDNVDQICQKVPQIHQPCQKASHLCQKISDEACQLCLENPEVSHPSQEVPVEVGRLAHGFPRGVGDLVQEIRMEVGNPTQETPEELSQPCQEFFAEVSRLTQEASAINLLSQDILEADKPSQEFPGEGDLQVQEVPEVNRESWVASEVIDQLPGEDIPQAQYPSGDPNSQSQSLAHDQYSPLPPATCD
ncbi:inositol hexakisphosphate and diphosphoinositol-pentakisphosphate kinase 1 isoform X1 [Mustela erminea]|uniref:inositol hexakisphosphate and diphosphoinositol-pentakisphosphate kinase 1 isoform X1 n=1 Tax=Mustela erminea TaxID=36723 RepID=UPI001386B4E7|nr:inositol hexakisphosphate and diphosphoinositol-pentakisphosphate kinase 1 isoform X1 [Mustela erminea]XP_032199385.1 inositol hexakisphosphate and diphosphoinositol-pentakisphosphate kinase 1 isoform X1 [Mustela erminea]XP_032199386.1 inositol hexakisphosphate and diphosphoinositol-pentakisphosphate kinase 1 isoform X1 [Mustela erminea]XP_032199387.1 inositol hexakisphosphate and diphosphoinositol-pentakisphosphate kinase 1 isoform X1 [Mustela erminea]XP_032199388.1 inositol hexakisphosphat